MRLSVNRYRTMTLAAMMAVSVTACKKPAGLVPMPKEYMQPRTTEIIDSLVKESKKISENSDFVYLGSDTLKLNKDFHKNPASFFDKTSLILKDKFNDKIFPVGYENTYSYPESSQIIRYKDCPDIYIDKTAIIPSKQAYTTDSANVYVPVEYYGKVNPEIRNFL